MYHAIVRRKLRKVFDDLNRGRYEGVLQDLAPRFEHVFFGPHALGGVRHRCRPIGYGLSACFAFSRIFTSR